MQFEKNRTKYYLLLLILLASCSPPGSLFSNNSTTSGPTDTVSWYDLYFSEPKGPMAQSQRGGPDAFLAQAIDAARLSVNIAMYDLNLWSIRDALLAAHRRGVTVQVIAESDNLDRDEFQELMAAGIPIIGDRAEALMHNKFVIIDRHEVWTGSMNFTLNGAYHNDNNLIVIRSTRLAENYLVEFDEMFIDDNFGARSPINTAYPKLAIDNTPIEIYFSPEDDVQKRIVELIEQAQVSVRLMAFSFTADPIGDALFAAHNRGVDVLGMVETSQASSQGTEFTKLVGLGVDINLDGNPKNMHHKVIVIDGNIVIMGSYNFTRSAEERNDENILIIFNSEIADEYLAEFDKIYAIRR
jgi:phosphatidylserine/phosphatidylglycerophosphate/cardiolipin synthase-like enzyme